MCISITLYKKGDSCENDAPVTAIMMFPFWIGLVAFGSPLHRCPFRSLVQLTSIHSTMVQVLYLAVRRKVPLQLSLRLFIILSTLPVCELSTLSIYLPPIIDTARIGAPFSAVSFHIRLFLPSWDIFFLQSTRFPASCRLYVTAEICMSGQYVV